MIREAAMRLIQKEDLDAATAEAVMDEIMSGNASEILISAYLTALAAKGETVEEITASAKGMRKAGRKFKHEGSSFEIVGTGGDGSNSFNISTTAAFVIAAAGVKVTKHGNRAASSKSGAADCLEALGANITAEPEKTEKVFEKCGFAFLFAQKYHAAMKYVAPVRKELGFRTVFNILGPLTNPAAADMQVMGVYSEELAEPLAKVLSNLGVKRGMTVYGTDKLDEASVCAPTKICEFENGEFKSYMISPEELGLKTYDKSELLGGTGKENADTTLGILSGKIGGAKLDAVLLNAACGLYVAGKANSIKSGVSLAKELVESGKALEKLNEFVRLTNEDL